MYYLSEYLRPANAGVRFKNNKNLQPVRHGDTCECRRLISPLHFGLLRKRAANYSLGLQLHLSNMQCQTQMLICIAPRTLLSHVFSVRLHELQLQQSAVRAAVLPADT